MFMRISEIVSSYYNIRSSQMIILYNHQLIGIDSLSHFEYYSKYNKDNIIEMFHTIQNEWEWNFDTHLLLLTI